MKKVRPKDFPEKYANNLEFVHFVDREFQSTSLDATLEELAEFAFGSTQEAIRAFEAMNRNREEDGDETI